MKITRFYGTTELAQALGWDKAKVHVYWKRGLIEEPKAYAGKRPLWSGEQVEKIKGNFEK